MVPVVGVVGAGQLGRMLHQAAIGPGFALRFLAEHDDDPAAQVAPDYELGSAMSAADLGRFAKACDVVTFEHEVVDLEGLHELERDGAVFRPSPSAIGVVADKLAMRAAVEAAGLPVPPWRAVDTTDQLDSALTGWPAAVLKSNRGGYDGRGVHLVADLAAGADIGRRILATGARLLVEPLLDFSMEAAVIIARRPGGETVVYDPVRTIQVDGQCREVLAPSGLAPELCDEARAIACRAAAALDVVGLLAIELFVVDGRLLVNELAVRPHNTGHHTIDACVTSQFENHLRAVLDLPLGATALTTEHVAMANIIAGAAGDDPADHLAAGLATDPGARIHLYGKQARPNRKVGHVTVCDDDPGRAAGRAWAVVAALHGDVPAGLGDAEDRR